MIDISKAIKIIDRETGSLGSEKVKIARSVGQVLREDIIADTDLPPFDRSQMDGFAVVAMDTKNAPVTLKIVGESAAGKGWHKTMKRGQAVRIMTGAPVPQGADSVQKVELTRELGALLRSAGSGGAEQFVEISEPAEKGRSIVRKGSEIKKGTAIFKLGEIVTENMIATLAAFGYAKVKVDKRPRVAILSTGSEIVDVNKKPGRDQIRNSNSAMLDVLCRKFGAETTIFPIVKDEISTLTSDIADAIKSTDILVITGGVSVGKYDLTKLALSELGAEIFFEKVRLKPGKPTVFARIGKVLIFGLPGNPVSAATAFYLFVAVAIRRLQCAVGGLLDNGVGILSEMIRGTKERDSYVPCKMSFSVAGIVKVVPLRTRGSSDFITFAQADCMAFVPRGRNIEKGSAVRFLILPKG